MRIVRIANFVAPRSGGLKTALRHLGAGYQAAGHEAIGVAMDAHATDSIRAAVDAVADRFGALDLLVNCIGIQIGPRQFELPPNIELELSPGSY